MERLTKKGRLNFADKKLSLIDEWATFEAGYANATDDLRLIIGEKQ